VSAGVTVPDGADLTPAEAVALQRRLREEIVLEPPPGFAPRLVAGADLSMAKGSARAYAGMVVLETGSLRTVEQAGAVAELRFPYVPGLLSFRELPPLALAWQRLRQRPDAIIFDGQGYAHPRRFGLACHGGLLFGIPSVGCAKSILVGQHGPLDLSRGSTAELVHRGEVVGMALRLRDGVRPVYVSAGHLIDLTSAVRLVLAMSAGRREPETTRRAHRLVNEMRVADG
jgi:deoxyribonuclease V